MESQNSPEEAEQSKNLSFECEGCGGFFESWDRLRQHQVDCRSDESDGCCKPRRPPLPDGNQFPTISRPDQR